MKLSAIALDYDGTIARDDVPAPGIIDAIAAVRAGGTTVLLVTGRRLADLTRVAGDLHFADVVVAENGAVVAFPATGYSTRLAAPVQDALLDALRQAQIPHAAGEVLIDARADDAGRILDHIRRLELPLVLVFNRGRVMVLPQAVSKATGLRHALTVLRLSPHNTIAIGDAENDHELLRLCELGVAVGWGSSSLQRVADRVLSGTGPEAVADYLRTLSTTSHIALPSQTRRRLLLGHTDDGASLGLAVRGRNVLIAGDPRSGKSWVAGLLCEQLIVEGYSVCVLDPEGDYASLRALPGVIVLGGADPLPRPQELLRALRHPDVSVVVDLSHTAHDEKLDYMRVIMPALSTLRRATGLPHRIVIDEAHYFLQEGAAPPGLDLAAGGHTLVTYRASTLGAAVLASSEAVIVTRESHPAEVGALAELCAGRGPALASDVWARMLGGLTVGQAAVLPITAESDGTLRLVRLMPRLTPHVRHLAKYVDIPVSPRRAFVFAGPNGALDVHAGTLREFVTVVEATSEPTLGPYMTRGDFSRWVGEVFGDHQLAADLRAIETQWRAGTLRDPSRQLGQAVRSRYQFVPGTF